ncbi:hypothetical protein WJX84_010243 [Apatococcus fuscideae]|uniref:Uncharacterized protein n=1 Tax=Apatococcus fuscideae TaxID=2026836 RepID=A0AAW1TG98_9CHLO
MQLQVGRLCHNGTWVSFAPFNTVAQGITKKSSLANLCEQLEDFCDFLVQTGQPPNFQAVSWAEALQEYSFRETVQLNVPMTSNVGG